MSAKLREKFRLWNRKAKEKAEEAVPRERGHPATDTPREENKTGAPDLAKAILYFKQRRGNGDISVPVNDEEHDGGIEDVGSPDEGITAPLAFRSAVVGTRAFAEDAAAVAQDTALPEPSDRRDMPEKPPETPAAEEVRLPPNRKGWISPTYTASRHVPLNPAFFAENRCLFAAEGATCAEAYRMLKTQILQRTEGTGKNTFMVTSTLPGEGKTLTAINLAFSLAREFRHTVLLVDADLKKQNVHKYLGFESDKGLTNFLHEGTPVADIIVWPGIEKMTIISGGPPLQESTEMLGSPRMAELVAELKHRYEDRIVIIDAPSIFPGGDALSLAPFVDFVIVVVRAGKTPRDEVKRAVQLLPQEKILGFVLNRVGSSLSASS